MIIYQAREKKSVESQGTEHPTRDLLPFDFLVYNLIVLEC